jgi:hypothetical protein
VVCVAKAGRTYVILMAEVERPQRIVSDGPVKGCYPLYGGIRAIVCSGDEFRAAETYLRRSTTWSEYRLVPMKFKVNNDKPFPQERSVNIRYSYFNCFCRFGCVELDGRVNPGIPLRKLRTNWNTPMKEVLMGT